jgi:MYXO-CTERM domain-containing protein
MGSCVDVQPPAGTAGGTTPNPVVDGGAVATGCGCRLQPSSDRPGQVALAAALFALALLRRRRATRT